MSPGRLETFADGVFAIAATLLILTVDGAVEGHGADLGESLRHAWPSYVGYVVSFVTIGIMWTNHHTVMSLIARVDRRFLLANLGLLMCIAFVPFPTRLLAENIRGDGAESAALAYGFTLTATAVFFNLVWFYAERGRRLLRADADPRIVAGLNRTYLPGPWIYLGATLVALASPTASALLYLAIAGLYVFESSLFGGRTATD
ncbi:MAG TPA: TMEM175 family protein [Gaiellaceae bacterium]|nr:TMEM175 family protein [Gaiellaceae bacterium]